MSGITMTGYMGAITKGDPFVLDYDDQDNERLVRVSGVRPADDVCCEVRLYGDPSWMPEIEFRRRATLFVPGCATPSQRLDAATVERCEALRQAVANVLPSGDDRLPGDKVIPFYIRMDELRAIRALATEPHQHGGKA